MKLINGDCLEVMNKLDDNSIDFLFADLPYAQTSCKWDSLIDLKLFWKQVNRICKDDSAMAFTCSVKFGNSLINSNPKCFRYDLVWIKSAPCGFLNAKKMPMKKHEMIYIFYKKLPKVYTENIALHHTHKFLKDDYVIVEKEENDVNKNAYCSNSLYGNESGKIRYKNSDGTINKSLNETKYSPPLPNSIIKEENVVVEKTQISKKHTAGENNLYGNMTGGTIGSTHGTNYKPPLPNSIIKEETFKRGKNKSSTKKDVYNSDERFNNGKLYHHDRKLQKGDDPIYDPPLPNSIIKEEAKGNNIYNKFSFYNNGEKGYDPPLPNTIMEIKSEKGKHPTQKPVPLMEWLIKYYTREGDVVLDPTMGSGGTGIACKNLNREFIGIEKDKEIYKVALERNN
jgi:DNA modification methylase